MMPGLGGEAGILLPTTGTFLSACLISACQAARSCGELQCAEGQQCCPPTGTGTGNGSGSGSAAGGSASVRCCKLPIHIFFDNVGWVTRKLSGILILLLLFAMGYFIQRIICPRPRRHQHHMDRPPEEPTTASQDSLLLDRYPEYSLAGGDFTSPPPCNLPAYDEVKYLPTYEESMRETLHRDRSDDHLLCEEEEEEEEERTGAPGPGGRGRAAAPAPPGPCTGQQRRDPSEVSGHGQRVSRNSV